jgi:lysozyme family protein
MTIDSTIDATIGKEGGYVNHKDDKGGETIWGITVAVARANGYTGAMRDMPRSTAVAIYKSQYFEKPGFAGVAVVSSAIAEELFDTGVNMGPHYPSLWLQQWLNALNRGGKDYADIAEDGIIGKGTVGALGRLIAVRGRADAESVLLKGLNCSQGARYLELARGRVQNESFVFGWMANRVGLS